MEKEKLLNLKEEIERLEKRRLSLIQIIGKKEFNSIVDAFNQITIAYNLDKTPTILKDLFDYLVEVTCININP